MGGSIWVRTVKEVGIIAPEASGAVCGNEPLARPSRQLWILVGDMYVSI